MAKFRNGLFEKEKFKLVHSLPIYVKYKPLVGMLTMYNILGKNFLLKKNKFNKVFKTVAYRL